MHIIDTDYLVVGAGASGLAFTDALIADSGANVVIVDRRDSPGGHWNDAYPFVKIHHASAVYGVNSLILGTDSIDKTGPNAGFYERSGGAEICAYFQHVMDDVLLPSGQVKFYNLCSYTGDWANEHTFISHLTGETTTVRVRKKVVDTTYLEVSVPSTHKPSFPIDPDVNFVPVGELAKLTHSPSGYTILGGGKTAMDACTWLLDNGENPERIRWVRPRDSWVFDRKALQPLDLVTETMDGFSLGIEALAQTTDPNKLWLDLEDRGQLFRLDQNITPTMFRGAIVSADERALMAQIKQVVRLGRVKSINTNKIELAEGEISSDDKQLLVDCTAYGFGTKPVRPIFESQRIVIQSLIGGHTTYNAALIGFIESTARNDEEKNRLCPPVAQVDVPLDWVRMIVGMLNTSALHNPEPDIVEWQGNSRLSLSRGIDKQLDNERMQLALKRWQDNSEQALINANHMLDKAST